MQMLQMKETEAEPSNPNRLTENPSDLTWEDIQGLSWIFEEDW